MNPADTSARPETSPARWRRPFLIWIDGIEAGWAIPLLLIGFIAVWLAFFCIAYLNGDLHPDVLEAWSSGRRLEWGYARHAPLAAWLAHGWASVFPLTNWSFQLLALANSAAALLAIDLISRRFVRGDQRLLVLLLLLLLPVYQLLAQPFNADAVLLAAWPIATYCFLRSFETRQKGWAIAAGTTAALAMLGKYYSVFLIVSFIFAAICHPRRRAYFASPAPWVAAFAGVAALGPHLYWLATTGAQPFGDMLAQLASKAFAPAAIETFLFMLILALVIAIPVLIWSLVSADRFKRLSEEIGAIRPGIVLLFTIGVGIVAFPTVAAVALGTDIIPVWGIQSIFPFAILIVCGASDPVPRERLVKLAGFAAAIAAVSVLAVAPLHALYRNFYPLDQGRSFYQLSAAELTRQWHAQSDQAMPAVGGDRTLALATAFYSPDHPVADERLLQPNAGTMPPETNPERGWASLCFASDARCIPAMEKAAAGASRLIRSDFAVQSKLLGLAGARQQFTALLALPAVAAPAMTAPPAVAPPPAPVPPPSPAAPTPPPAIAALPAIAPPPPAAAAPPPVPPSVASGAVTLAPLQNAGSATELAGGPTPDVQSAPKAPPPAFCCAPELKPDGATRRPEPASSMPVAAKGRNKRTIRVVAATATPQSDQAAVAEFHLNWVRWAAARRARSGCSVRAANGWGDPCCASCWSAARTVAAHWRPARSAGCRSREGRRGCGSAPREIVTTASAGSARTADSICVSDNGDPTLRRPLLAQLAQPLCALAGALGARPRLAERITPAGAPAPLAEASTAQPRLSRGERPVGFAAAALVAAGGTGGSTGAE